MAGQVPNKGALIGPGFYTKLQQTIARVDGEPYSGGVTKIPTDLSGGDTFVPKTFRIGTFSGAWGMGSDKVVTFRGVTTSPNTVMATNLFYNLPDDGTTDCAIAKDGTAWYLVQEVHTQVTVITGATLTTAGLQFTRAILNVVCTATASTVSITTVDCSTATTATTTAT